MSKEARWFRLRASCRIQERHARLPPCDYETRVKHRMSGMRSLHSSSFRRNILTICSLADNTPPTRLVSMRSLRGASCGIISTPYGLQWTARTQSIRNNSVLRRVCNVDDEASERIILASCVITAPHKSPCQRCTEDPYVLEFS
jgi:hypothetical protein